MNASLPIDLWGWQQGPEAERREAPPASALIHQNRNNGIESFPYVIRDEFKAGQEQEAVNGLMNQLPSRLRKKTFALRLRIEWMVATHGVNNVGLQTMTIRENVTDRKEFERRFKSIATNAFPKIYLEWLRVFERQQRGAWHAHVVVVTKEDIRTGTDVVALNQLLKDKRDRKISKAIYYSGIKRLASPNLKAVWKEFRRLCGLGEFKARRKKKGARYYKFDACHLLPIISTAQALAVYVSKYISKGFQCRRPENKGMRLVGSTRNVSRVCNERFSWANGGGKLHRLKLGILAKMFAIDSLDGFAERFGSKWAYHLGPVLKDLDLPYYEDMKLAKLDGWDLHDKNGEPWPLPDLELSAENVGRSHLRAYVRAKEILLRRSRQRPDQERPCATRFKARPAVSSNLPARPAFKACWNIRRVKIEHNRICRFLLFEIVCRNEKLDLFMNVSLTPELEKFVTKEVNSGLYQTASEVVRAGLRRLKEERDTRAVRLPATLDELENQLVQAVNSLDAGKGVNGETMFRRLRKRIKDARG